MSEKLGQTPSQTVGPYFAMRIAQDGENVLPVPEGAERIVISGKVLDADGNHVEDALVETWQANPAGRYNHPDDQRDLSLSEGFTGFARAKTDFETGEYRVETVKPGPVPDPEGEPQAPHISLIIQARGMLNPVFTRIYFSDEPEANDHDLVMRRVPAERRKTLIAEAVAGSDPREYRFDIKLQGDNETVFFDV
ncbi:MAG: protocatechuate 3,4-dioxygenase subunit alpha [Acidimicrobiia bacterium]|jgi:protocatechuate 3,4-dioxygenase alpha subunit